jgi:hypothetical protein
MTSMLSRAIAALRVWLGFNDPAQNHPYRAHGWLLPSVIHAHALAHAGTGTAPPADLLEQGPQK